MTRRLLAARAAAALTVAVVAVIAVIAGSAGVAGAADAAARRPLRVAVSLPAPGFWNGRTAEAGGFEADLARALADRLGFDGVRVVDTPFRRIVRGRFDADVAISEVTITEARRREVDFTGEYLQVDQTVLTAAAGPPGPLADLRWGVVRASTGADTLRRVVRPGPPPTGFASEVDAVAALRAGRVDAVLIDSPLAARLAAASDGAIVTGGAIPTAERYGVVLPEGSRLRRRATAALAALVGDGTVARLAAEAGIPDHLDDPAFIT